MIHSLAAQRPARIFTIAAGFLCFTIWYVYQPETIIRCEVPIVVEQHFPATTPTPSVSAGIPPASQVKHSFDSEADDEIPQTRANYSKIAKVSVATNKLDNPNIHRAIKTHELHNSIHGYRHFIAAREAVSDLIEHDVKRRPAGAWTKPAYLLSLIVNELQKEEDERLEWLFWFDADTVVMNPQTPLEVFVPPTWNADLQNIHLLMASNWDGLNSGAFGLRVHPWSVSLLSAVLAYPIYETERMAKDRFRDQSAFQWLLTGDDSPLASQPMKGRDHWVEIPMRWFNSIPFNNAFGDKGQWILNKPMTEETFDKGTDEVYNDGNPLDVKPWKVMRGDMVVHFAGTTAADVRDSWLGPWLDRAEALLPEWSNSTTAEVLKSQTREFWTNVADKIVAMRTQSQSLAHPEAQESADDKKGGSKKEDSKKEDPKKDDSKEEAEQGSGEPAKVPPPPEVPKAKDQSSTTSTSTTAAAAATKAASEHDTLLLADEAKAEHDSVISPNFEGGIVKVHVPRPGEY